MQTMSFRLLAADGTFFESRVPGTLGGNRRLRIYGRLDCPSAARALSRGYAERRVFFRDEATAAAAGYRPCAKCLPERYREWKRAQTSR
jgi:methylphosphotriester-DNA--protein-cysteine methyltransferase